VKRLKELERESAKLKQLMADVTLNDRILRDANKKVVRLSERRRVVDCVKKEQRLSDRRAYQVLDLNRSSYRYRPAERCGRTPANAWCCSPSSTITEVSERSTIWQEMTPMCLVEKECG